MHVISHVKYLDSLDLKDMAISDEGTRVSLWTNAMVRKAINHDTASDGCFGMAQGHLIDARFDLRELINRCFQATDTYRLDQKDTICFPVLQKFTRLPTETSGHYWLVVLNLTAQRFEIIDSLGKQGQPLMMDACHLLIAGIKYMWTYHYKESKVQINNREIEVIDCPRQNTRMIVASSH